MAKINTILQCFVDLNLETDENTTFSLNLPEISFAQQVYNVDEGNSVAVVISLSEPSLAGLEEVEVDIVLNNTSVSDFSTNGQSYPQTLSFSAGQQTHTLFFNANTDFIEEGIESFDVILGFFTNIIPGQFITTTVNIIDLTNLKEVFINQQGGILVSETDQNPALINFSVIEGASKNITISLDSPSVLGIESVQAQLTNISTSSNDYLGNITTTFSWAPGEQNKTLQISTISDNILENSELLKINLINPVNVNLASPIDARLEILDNSPEYFYANFNIQGSYIQYGGINGPTVEARWVNENVNGLTTEPFQENRFLKFGHGIEKAYTAFNSPNGSSQGYGYDAGSNIIIGYNSNYNSYVQSNNVIFFGGKPPVTFGAGNTIINNSGTKTYGDLRLRITNEGTHPVLISGSTITTGDHITVVVDRFDFNITLPTNSGLLPANNIFQGQILPQDTLTQCVYNFTFEVDFEEVGFKLRDRFNSVSLNKEINIGTHTSVQVFNLSNASLPQNRYNLVTQLNNVWPFWESDFSFPQIGPYCLLGGDFVNNLPAYPTNNSDLKRVLIDGMLFLHQDASTENSTSTTKTMYENFMFLSSGQTAAASGCIGVDIEYPPALGTNAPYTSSIPFKVI